MALQILSDLHLEAPQAYDVFKIVPKAPYLALLGDIGNVVPHKDDFLAFLTLQLKQFRIVFFVPGNHEAYDSNWPRTLDILRAFEQHVRQNSSLGGFVLLDRESFPLPGTNTTILGCSLFSHIPPESEMRVSLGLNDFFQTSDWDVKMHNEAHKKDLAWLNAQVGELAKSDEKIIILSHWSPSLDAAALEPRHAGSPITSGFSTDLSQEECFKNDKVKVWAFGHTHYNCDFTAERQGGAEGLRLLANQRGYYFAQAEGYDGEKIIEV